MRFIPTKVHAAMDYVGGALLILVPLLWLNSAREAEVTAAVWTPVVIGVLMLLQSMFTDYELSLSNVLPVSAHLGVDALAGAVLAASPWLFGFSEVVWIPHLVLGLLEIGAALTTKLHRGEPAVGTQRHSRSPSASA